MSRAQAESAERVSAAVVLAGRVSSVSTQEPNTSVLKLRTFGAIP